MIEQTLRALVEHPRRLWIVIIVTFVVGLVTILPLADEYSALLEEHAELEVKLTEAKSDAANVVGFRERVTQERHDLAELERRTVSEEQIHDYRAEVVRLVRDAGCQLRRISVGDPLSRDWLKEDDPLSNVQGNAGKRKNHGTGYELKTQSMTLSVSGGIADVKTLLAELAARRNIVHTKNFAVRPAGADRDEIVLELEIWLFDLEQKKSVAA